MQKSKIRIKTKTISNIQYIQYERNKEDPIGLFLTKQILEVKNMLKKPKA